MGCPATKIVGKIFSTTNYDMFKLRVDNRPVDEPNVRLIMKSFEIMGQQLPVKVDANHIVQDGQHRLEACRRMDIPVKFIIDEKSELSTKQLALLQSTTKGWSNADYAHSFAQTENGEDYRLYKEFSAQYSEFGHSTILLLLMNFKLSSSVTERNFKDGTFKIKSYNRGKQMAETLRKMAPFYANYHKKSFIVAFIKMYEHKDFDMAKLMRKLPKRCKELMDFSRTEDYLDTLQTIYNWKETKKVYFS